MAKLTSTDIYGSLYVQGVTALDSTLSAKQLTSTIADGTAPLVVASTTLNTNLNADLLDGNHASAFYLATNPNGYTTNTGTVTSVAAGNGMNFTTITGTGSVTMGTPSSLTDATTNAVTATSHTHAITTYAVSGTSNQITVSGSPKVLGSATTLSLPQNIHTGATPTFGRLSLTQAQTDGSTAAFTSPHLALNTTTAVDTTGFVGMTFATSPSASYGWSYGAQRTSGGNGDLIWRNHDGNSTGVERMRLSDSGTLTVQENFVVHGNLTVNGTTTTLNTATLNVSDNIIVLNNDVTGTPTENAGIEVERGTSANVLVRWNETSDRWEFTNNGSKYFNIPTSTEYTNNPGTVTSVAMTVPTGLSISGSPITTSGTLAVGLQSGYSIPTTTNQTNWTDAYNKYVTSITGSGNGTLTITKRDGTTITSGSLAHGHGNITSAGAIGSTADLVAVTGASGVLTTASRSGIDSRSTFPPSAHSITTHSATAWRMFFSNATTSAIQQLALGAAGTYLRSGGASANPTFSQIAYSEISGTPTIGNGTLTMNTSGSGISGSATFTANQTGASTFTVTSNATTNATANTISLRDADGNITTNDEVQATNFTMKYDSTSKSIKFTFA